MEDPEVARTWSQKAGAGLGYPPYQSQYERPPPPSVANTVVGGRDVRRIGKPNRPREPVAKPPLPRSVRNAKVKPPRAIDVNVEGQEWRADPKCYKRHTICLSERMDRLSRPRRRYIINQWREYHKVLSPEQINTLHEMLCCEAPKSCKPYNPDQAYDFFKAIKPKKKKQKCCKKSRKLNKDLMLLCGNRGLSWARNAVVAVARGIQLKLARPGCCVLKNSMQRLSDIILSEMVGYMGFKCRPSRRSKNSKSKFMIEMADKIAVWIDEIMSDAEARMLLMDFDDDEDNTIAGDGDAEAPLGPDGRPLKGASGPDGKPLLGPDGKPLYIAMGPDGKPVLVGADGKPILGPGGKPLQVAIGPDGKPLVGPDGKPMYSTIGPDGKPMLVGADGKPILGPSGKPLQVAIGPDGKPLVGPDGKPMYTTIGPDGKPILVGADGKPILGQGGKPLQVAIGADGKPLLGPDGKPLFTTIGPDGKPMLVGADGKAILGPGGKSLQVAIGPDGKPLVGPDGKPMYTTIGPDGKPILVGADGRPILGPDGKPLQVAIGLDGKSTLIGTDGKPMSPGVDGKPISDTNPLYTAASPAGEHIQSSVSPNGKSLTDTGGKLLNVQNGKPVLGPNGQKLYTSVGPDGKAILVDADGNPVLGIGGKPIQTALGPDGKPLLGADGKPLYTTIGPDGKPMLVGADGKPILGPGGKPLQAAMGADGKPLRGPDGNVLYTTIGPDGKPMLVGADGKPILGPAGKPLQTAFGPDGKPLLGADGKPLYTTIGPDGKPMLVGADGKPILGPGGKPLQAAIGADGKPLLGPDGRPVYTTIGPDGKPMLVGADGKPILGPGGKPLQVAIGADGKPLLGPDGKPLYVTIGPDGKPMSVGADGKAILASGGKPMQAAAGTEDGRSLNDADGKLILGPGVKSPDGKALHTTITDTTDGADRKQMLGSDGKSIGIAPGLDGKPLQTALGPDGKPKLEGKPDGKPLFAAAGPAGERIQDAKSSYGKGPDGQNISSSVGPDGQAKSVAAAGKRLAPSLQPVLGPDGKPLLGPDGKPLYTTIGPDGKPMLVGADGKPILGSDGKPLLIAFGPNGKPLLGPDGKLLQAAVGPDGKPLLGADGKPLFVALGPDGKPLLGPDGEPLYTRIGPGGKPERADEEKHKFGELMEKVKFYRGGAKLDLISEMQRKFNEKLIDTQRSANRESIETYFYAAQRLKMAQSTQKFEMEISNTKDLQTRWQERKQEEIQDKLKECIKGLSVPKSEADDIREFIPKVLPFLSTEVDNPVPEIEAFIALLKKMDEVREEPMVKGKISMSRGEVSDYLKSVPTYEDTINKPDSALKSQVKKQLQDIVKALPPSQAYTKQDMADVIDHQAGLLASYVTHQKAKTKILEAMVVALAQEPETVLLRHGTARMSNRDAAEVLQGKTTAQLSVFYRADDIVARKLAMNLIVVAGRTAHYKDPDMPELLGDLTDYLAQVLLQPKAANWLKK